MEDTLDNNSSNSSNYSSSISSNDSFNNNSNSNNDDIDAKIEDNRQIFQSGINLSGGNTNSNNDDIDAKIENNQQIFADTLLAKRQNQQQICADTVPEMKNNQQIFQSSINLSGGNTSSNHDDIDAKIENDHQICHSGINLSGVRKVFIRIAAQGTGEPHEGAIERIQFEFNKPVQSHEPKVPFYDGVETFDDGSIERVFEVEPDNPIHRIVICRNDRLGFVEYIQFVMKSGSASEIYGKAQAAVKNSQCYCYYSDCPDGELLAGVVAYHGKVLQKIHFLYSKVPPSPPTMEKVVVDDNDEYQSFSSGINLSGVRKVYIRIAAQGTGKPYEGSIQRIHLEFNEPLQSHEPKVPFYDGIDTFEDGSIERVLEIEPDNPIVGVMVWQNVSFVEAIEFVMKSGAYSETYGKAPEDIDPDQFCRVACPDAELAGIDGQFGKVLRDIDFYFDLQIKKKKATPSIVVDHDASHPNSTMQRQAYEDAWVGRAIFVGIFISSVLASLISSSSRRK